MIRYNKVTRKIKCSPGKMGVGVTKSELLSLDIDLVLLGLKYSVR